MAPRKPDITLYTSGTPSGQKASITFEELGLLYTVENIQISNNVQKEDWFLKINPNGRIRALGRYDPDHKLSFPYDSDEYWEVVEWLTWMQSGLGPMRGQANHFYRYAPEKIQ